MEEQDKIDYLISIQKRRCSVYGLTYNKALAFIADLKKEGIDASITVGGVAISANSENEKLIAICKKYNTSPKAGLTRMQEEAFFPTTDKRN